MSGLKVDTPKWAQSLTEKDKIKQLFRLQISVILYIINIFINGLPGQLLTGWEQSVVPQSVSNYIQEGFKL